MYPVRMSIVTYNLWGTERLEQRSPALQRFCTTYLPDVMGVQELSVESGALIDEALPDHARVEDDFSAWTTEGNIWWHNGLFELVAHGAEDIGIEPPTIAASSGSASNCGTGHGPSGSVPCT
jgi:hypothetical protein